MKTKKKTWIIIAAIVGIMVIAIAVIGVKGGFSKSDSGGNAQTAGSGTQKEEKESVSQSEGTAENSSGEMSTDHSGTQNEGDNSDSQSGGVVASGTDGYEQTADAYQEYDFSSLDQIEDIKPFEPNLTVNTQELETGTGTVEEEEKDITCDSFGRFSGQYLEDGTDELVESVAAVLITNRSNQYLEYAALTFDINGKAANFIVTGLPAGKSAWVMEANRLAIEANAVFTCQDCVSSFRSDAVTSTEKITLKVDGNMMRATNNTEKSFTDVVVYYRILHTDGYYLSGVTYTTTFEKIEPGETAESLAGHYSIDNCKIVRVSWKES